MADVGTIRGQMVLDVKQALASFTAVRLANLATVTALSTGGGALVAVGAGMLAVGAGILYALKGMVDVAAEFERKLDFYGAVADANVEDMERVRDKALQLGQDSIYSAGQIADAFVELGKAGVGVEDLINGVGEAVVNLGAAADIPLDTAAQIMLAAVQTFRLSAEDATHVADLLAGAANASIVEVQDLGVSLKYAGGTANSLGIPLEEVIDALGLLGTYGIKGSTAGTSLRQVLLSLGGTTKKSKDLLKELGIITKDGGNQFYDAAGKAKPLSEIFQILQDATAGMSAEQKTAAFRTIFATRAMSAALSLTKEGAAGFDKMNAAISKTTAAEVAGKRLDNLSGDIEILRGNLETLAIKNGSQLQAFLRDVVQGLTKVVNWFTNLSPSVQRTIIITLAVIGVFMTLFGMLVMVGGGILILISTVIKLAPAFKLLGAMLKAAAVAQWAFNSALLANPITWIVIAVIALIAVFILLWKNNKTFRDFFIKMWAWIKTAAAAVVNWFKNLPKFFSGLWKKIVDTAKNLWNSLIAFIKSIPQKLLALFLNFTLIGLLIKHWETIKQGVITAFTAVLDFFKALPGKIGAFFAELPGLIGYWIGFAIGFVLGLIIDGVQLWYNTWVGVVTAIVEFFMELPGRLVAIFTTVKDWVIAKVTEFALAWWNLVVTTVTNVITFFQELPGKILAAFQTAKTWAINKFNELKDAAITIATNLFNAVVDFFVKLPERIRDAFVTAKTWVTDKFNQVKDKAIEIATSIYTEVRDWILKIPTKVKEIFEDAIKNITNIAGKAKDAVTDFAGGLWEGFKDGLGIHSPSYIEEAMWQITGVLDEETQAMVKQVQAIQGMGNDIAEVGNNLGVGFDDSLSSGLTSMQEQIKAAQAYSQELQDIASTVATAYRDPAIGFDGVAPIINEGNQVTLDVTWNASPNDQVDTRQQVKDLLGRSTAILGDDLENPNG